MTRFSMGTDFAYEHLMDNDALTATTEGDYIDTNGYESCTIIAIERATTASSGNVLTAALMSATVTPTSTASYAADTNFVGGSGTASTISATESASTVIHKFHYTGNARYLQLKLTETGTAAGTWSMLAILGGARHQESSTDDPTSGTVT